MKKVLFALMLLCASGTSIAQLRLNEVYRISDTSTVEANRQFFEVALAPTQTTSVNSDSYVLLSYFNTGLDSGFYVLDLPSKMITSDVDANITPGDFLVGASSKSLSSSFHFQNSNTSASDYYWKTPSANATTKKFTYDGSTFSEQHGPPLDKIFNFTSAYPQRIAVFLYRKPSGSTTMQIVDAFVATVAEKRATIPEEIFTFNNLTFPLKVSAGPPTDVTVVFNTTLNKYAPWGVVSATSDNDGYYFCSSWEKVIPHPSNPQNPASPLVTAKMTPRKPNTPTQGEPLMAQTDCKANDDFIAVTVTAGQVSPYPIHATLYADVNHNQKLDLNTASPDEYRSDITIKNKGEEYYMDKLPGDQDLIVVLDAAADCFDAILPFVCSEDIVTPVTLTTFQAQRRGANGDVQLNWQTASESNNKGFYLQRRNNADEAWQAVTFLASKATGGSSNSTLSYTFTDINLSKGITQYRLLQVDHDGKAGYSEILSVRGLEQTNKILVYPNPSHNGVVNVVFEDASALRNVDVTDMVGRIVKRWKGIGTGSMQITSLVPGVYHIRILNTKTGQLTRDKIVVTR